MTNEYALLSLRAGLIAGAIDCHLGSDLVISELRRMMAWKLTPEYIDGMKRLALECGVPQAELDVAEALAILTSKDAGLMQHMQELQEVVDHRKDVPS